MFGRLIDSLSMVPDSRQDASRFSGVLILHQLAQNAPSHVYPNVQGVLDKIWIPLRDSRVCPSITGEDGSLIDTQTMVRERASMLLSACLDIVKTRDKSPTETYRKIFDEARSGLLRASSTDSILGSLLAFGAMIQSQQIVRCSMLQQFYVLKMALQSMAEYYKSICELTLKYRDSKEVVVRKAVITLIPSMATYDSVEFEVHYLHRSMAYLLQALGKPTDRDIGAS